MLYPYTVFSNAKINLSLNIFKKNESDNLHKIQSMFVPISLYDEITIDRSEEFSVSYTDKSNNKITMENDILLKTLNVLSVPISNCNFSIIIKKNIPMGSGLGGASSNAAFFIKFLISIGLCTKRIDFKKVLKIGSDVPFFLKNKPSIVHNYGEKIIPMHYLPSLYYVIIYPNIHLNTSEMYKKFDEYNFGHEINKYEKYLKKMLQKSKKNAFSIKDIVANDFEKVLNIDRSDLLNLKQNFTGCLTTNMSGSGSSIYAVYDSLDAAKKCYESVSQLFTNVYLCHNLYFM